MKKDNILNIINSQMFLNNQSIQELIIIFIKKQINKGMSRSQSEANTREKARNLATDLQLIQLYSKPSVRSFQSGQRMIGLGALSNLLTHKNSHYSYTNEQRQRDQTWVINKKADLRPLINRVQTIKLDKEYKTQEMEKKKLSHFYIGPSQIINQEQFVGKSLQYLKYNLISQTLNINRKSTFPASKKKRLSHKPQYLPTPKPSNLRNMTKFLLYLKSVEDIFITEYDIENNRKSWINIFKANTKSRIWQILYSLLQTRKVSKIYQKIQLYQIALSSLKIVEAELNLLLPNNFQSILYYLTVNYLRKVDGKYESQGSLGPIWAISYALYRAGRKSEFYHYLPDEQMKKMFKIADQSIQMEKPQKIIQIEENKDVFHDQLVYALAGLSKYSSDYLCDPNSLDIAWIFLRNVGIFPEGEVKFRELQEDIFHSYNNSNLTETKIKNLLYLLCFDHLVELGPNDFIDVDDYLHFLIFLYHSPPQLSLCKNTSLLNQRLSQYLAQHLQIIMVQNPQKLPYYIGLIPHQCIANDLSSLLVLKKMLFKLKWKAIQKYLPSEILRQTLKMSCQKWVKQYGDHLEAAQLLNQYLLDSQAVLEILLKMNLVHLSGKKMEKNKIQRSFIRINQLIKQKENISLQYKNIFQFVQEHFRLQQAISERNQEKLYGLIKSLKHVLISSNIRVSTNQVFEKLIQLNSFDSYISYMKDVIKAYEICLTKMGKVNELQQLYRITLQAIVNSMGPNEQHGRFVGKASLNQLITMIEQGLYRYA